MIKQKLLSKKTVKPTLFLLIVSFWIILNIGFTGKYIQIIKFQDTNIKLVTSCLIIFWIITSSFYACYHLWSFIISLLSRKTDCVARNYATKPQVAIFYTCKNDMNEKSVKSCINQDYINYNVYILDDSTDVHEREHIDELIDKYPERLIIIRRDELKGFKAGNINNALRIIGNEYKYICVVDADEILPCSFVSKTVAIAEGNEDIGFVQASHRQYSINEYGRKTGDGIDLHWNYFLPSRNQYGFVYFYGHGALLRTDLIKSIGGFPEIVSEDLAFTTKIRELGFRGYYSHDILCYEETPPTYSAFRRRNKKIISGTLEYYLKYSLPYFKSNKVSLIEKIDLIISSSIMYLPIPFMLYIFLLHFIIPILSNVGSISNIFSLLNRNDINLLLITTMFRPFGNIESIFFLFFIIFSPLIYFIPNILRSPKKLFFYFPRMIVINLSICLQTIGETIKWIVTKKSVFTPTGDRTQRSSLSRGVIIEFSIGFLMIFVGVLMSSFYLMAVGLSLLLIPLLIKYNLSKRFISILIFLPMLMTMIDLSSNSLLAMSTMGLFSNLLISNHY